MVWVYDASPEPESKKNTPEVPPFTPTPVPEASMIDLPEGPIAPVAPVAPPVGIEIVLVSFPFDKVKNIPVPPTFVAPETKAPVTPVGPIGPTAETTSKLTSIKILLLKIPLNIGLPPEIEQ